MAFESLPAVKVKSPTTGEVFIFSDYFSRWDSIGAVPNIYSWSDLKHAAETKDAFILDFGAKTYSVSKTGFESIEEMLRARAILEGSIAELDSVTYKTGQRVLPEKTHYIRSEDTEFAFAARGHYTEREINYGNTSLFGVKMGRYLFLSLILTFIGVFFALHVFFGNTNVNWVFYLPISAFSGIGVALFIYLFSVLRSKLRFKEIIQNDVAVAQEITFVLSETGFCATESAVYTGSDMIPWSSVDSLSETINLFILTNNGKPMLCLPKRLFDKTQQAAISSFIAQKLNGRR